MVTLEAGRPMLFAGSTKLAAFLELRAIGLPANKTGELSRSLCELVDLRNWACPRNGSSSISPMCPAIFGAGTAKPSDGKKYCSREPARGPRFIGNATITPRAGSRLQRIVVATRS